MTREHKLALVVGFGLILFVGILVTDHLAADARNFDPLRASARPRAVAEITLAAGSPEAGVRLEPAEDPTNTSTISQGPEVVLDPRPGPARPIKPLRRDATPDAQGLLAGDGRVQPDFEWHVISRGETLSDIAREYLGNGGRWRDIANANRGIDPNSLPVGRRIRIPVSSSATGRAVASREPASRPSSTSTRSYKVRSNDSLARIANRELGKESRWREIKDLNDLASETILPGQVLLLPTR